MKKILILLLVIQIAFVGNAQHNGVQFFEGSYEEALNKAKVENKQVFIDFYTDWCKPCKAVAQYVFPSDTAAAFFNARFINLKVDAEKGDGVALAKQFEINSYPTFMVLDAGKSVKARWSGASMKPTASKFIQKVISEMETKSDTLHVRQSEAPMPLPAVQPGKPYTAYYNAIKSEADPFKKEQLLLEMEKSGVEEAAMPGFDILDFSKQLVAQALEEEGNIEKARYWIAHIKDDATKTTNMLYLVRGLIAKDKIAEAENILEPVYDHLKANPAPAGQGRTMMPAPTLADAEQLYGAILYRKGEYKKSLQYLAAADKPSRRGGGSANSEVYAMALAKAGETDKALEAMNQLILSPGHRSEAFKTVAQQLFIKKYGNDTRYKALIDSATNREREKLEAKVTAMKVNEPAPDFELTDLNGKKQSLKSLRGKTVILDFWATWCQPCVASFPGMQKAVDYYRNDSAVVFLFIHTSEKNENAPEEARQFMKYKKYRFDVYMDVRDKNTHKSPVAASFNVRGIPAKFVIDRNGIIRYQNTGYISEEEAIPEIKTMVESIR